MALYMIGIGLSDEKDITIKGLEAVKKCSKVFLESYTSRLLCDVPKLEKFYGKKIIVSDRELVEKKAEDILESAKKEDIAFLVIGDVFCATTHTDLKMRAIKKGIIVKVINNSSVLTAIGECGLELYKFGKTTSIPYPEDNWIPETAYDVIKANKLLQYHTLCLLDIKKDQERFMTINEAIEILMKLEKKRNEKVFLENTMCVGCARLGNETKKIVFGTVKELKKTDFGGPLHCLIVPGKMHFMEEEVLNEYKIK